MSALLNVWDIRFLCYPNALTPTPYFCQYTLNIVQHIAVAEADDPIAALFQPFRTCLVILYLLRVTVAIHFNHQFVFGTVEIYDELADRMLFAEL